MGRRRIHVVIALMVIAMVGSTALGRSNLMNEKGNPKFSSAVPVWIKGQSTTKNLTANFVCSFSKPLTGIITLRCAGSTLYRVFINGSFVTHGPARGPHGWFRIDEIDITPHLNPGSNTVAIEVAGYNINSFATLDQASFLQAEIASGKTVLASTNGKGSLFQATVNTSRVMKTQRYSFQRAFSEAYKLDPNFDQWRVTLPPHPEKLESLPAKNLLPRRVAFPTFAIRFASSQNASGQVKVVSQPKDLWKDRGLTGIGPMLGGYLESELETTPSIELQKLESTVNQAPATPYVANFPIEIDKEKFQIFDFGFNNTGFIGSRVTCIKPSRVIFTFDEILRSGDVDFKRMGCVNAIEYKLQPGTYDLESFEPYTLRYLKATVLEGDCQISNIHLREMSGVVSPDCTFHSSDDQLNRLFNAGIETFRQNSLDVFMDCPSRERAGWLCDSFFTARVAHDVAPHSPVERNQFEAFLLPKSFKFLPSGMLPMCYPSDHNDGVFIPNWAMWFVVQLEEYLDRTGDRATVDALRPRLESLLTYFNKFRNSDGLLEKLDGWVFVEWSDANNFVQDVNYPSNMLYAEVLSAMGRMYGRNDLTTDAEKIRKTIRAQSFDGHFFVDNAIRKDGKLQITTNRSEVCQYFAFFFHTADRSIDANLWQTLVSGFGPDRKKKGLHPEIRFANAFIGNVLRLELLSQAGLTQQLLDESLAYQMYMVDRTGTLWENDGDYASCNHGFASHGGVVVPLRDLLGLYRVDTVKKHIQVRFTNLDLQKCEGSIPTPDGKVSLSWVRTVNEIRYRLRAPQRYTITVENLSKLVVTQDRNL